MELKHLHPEKSAGFSLLESMIALVVFSVALLGLAAMYTKTLSVSHSSYLRTLATIQAMDLEERIRANPRAADSDYAFDCGAPAAADPQASVDVQAWCNNTTAVFGGLLLQSTVTQGGGALVDYTITLQWSERALGDENRQNIVPQTFTYMVRR